MKKLFTLIALCTAGQVSLAQTIMNIYQNNGTTVSLPISTIDSITFVSPPPIMIVWQTGGGPLSVILASIDSITYTFPTTGGVVGTISSLNCNSATHSGMIYEGTETDWNVRSTLPYVGGNGGFHNGQTVNSTGVTGLTATLYCPLCYFETGSGTLTYNITGTANGSGTANFALNIGGQSCTLTRAVIGILNPDLPYGTVTDQDGNTYATITIGTQEWMAHNLRSATYANGDPIPNVTTTWLNLTTDAWAHYYNDSQYEYPHGKLYNWFAVFDQRNICPSGWHVPSDQEWNTLIGYLDPGMNPNATGEIQSNTAGGKMKSPGMLYWESPNNAATNESGFSGVPGGWRTLSIGSLANQFSSITYDGKWWSSSANGPGYAYSRTISYYYGRVYRSQDSQGGLSVRCVKDVISSLDCNSATNSGTLIQGTAASGVSSSVPYAGGSGAAHNGQTVNSTGVPGLSATLAAGTLSNGDGILTYTISGTANWAGTASFAIGMGGQECTLNLTVNAAVVSVLNPNLTYGSMTDQDGNTYATIIIGTQEWMAENLRTTTYANGDLIPNVTNANQWGGLTNGAWAHYNNDSQYEYPQGKLYNWYAVDDSRNLCPVGWHVPSDDEWYIMEISIDSTVNNSDTIGSCGTDVGWKMKTTSTGLWNGNSPLNTNESGFSGVAGGFRWVSNTVGTFNNLGSYGNWWSASANGSDGAWYRYVVYNSAGACRDETSRRVGGSVRCVRD
jgi:uncharacterized protein (TIGR02145 family)